MEKLIPCGRVDATSPNDVYIKHFCIGQSHNGVYRLPCGSKKAKEEEGEDSSNQADSLEDESQTLSVSLGKLCYQELSDHYAVVRRIGSGTFGNVLLALCLKDHAKVALKKLAKTSTKLEDFVREYHFSRLFSKHQSVVKTFDVAFETRTSYVFAQEYAAKGDLLKCVPPRVGLPESSAKLVVRQVSSAIEYIHGKGIVHRDIKLENVLVFDDRLMRVKLADFGVARHVGTMVCKVCNGTTYTPPEICDLEKRTNYRVEKSADVWSFGIVIFCLLTGSFPWQLARLDCDVLFHNFVLWQTKRTSEVPEHWRAFSPTLLRLFRAILEVRPKKRSNVDSSLKFIEHSWTASNSDRGHNIEVDQSSSTTTIPTPQAVNGDVINTETKTRLDKVNNWLISQLSMTTL